MKANLNAGASNTVSSSPYRRPSLPPSHNNNNTTAANKRPSSGRGASPDMESLLGSFLLQRRQSCPMAMAIPMPSSNAGSREQGERLSSLPPPTTPREYTFVPDKRSRPQSSVGVGVGTQGLGAKSGPGLLAGPGVVTSLLGIPNSTVQQVGSVPMAGSTFPSVSIEAQLQSRSASFVAAAKKSLLPPPSFLPPSYAAPMGLGVGVGGGRALTFHQLEFDAQTLKAIDRPLSSDPPLSPSPPPAAPLRIARTMMAFGGGGGVRPAETEEAAHILIALQSQN